MEIDRVRFAIDDHGGEADFTSECGDRKH